MSVNILLGYFGPFCWELMPTPTPSFLGLGALWTPCLSHGIFQTGALCIGCHLICVHSAAMVQAALWGPQWSWVTDWAGSHGGAAEPHPRSRSRKQTPVCIHLGSWGHRTISQRRKRGHRPGSCTPRGPRSPPGMEGKMRSGVLLSSSLSLKELLHVKLTRTPFCPQRPSMTS